MKPTADAPAGTADAPAAAGPPAENTNAPAAAGPPVENTDPAAAAGAPRVAGLVPAPRTEAVPVAPHPATDEAHRAVEPETERAVEPETEREDEREDEPAPAAGAASAGSGLTDRERDILAFERQWWKHAGAKEQAIRDAFDISTTRYYQLLNGLLDNPAALAAEPMVVGRLRRLRSSRARSRRR